MITAAVCSMGFGCATISDCTYEAKQKVRTQKAWMHYDGCEDACYSLPYRHGWKAGYYDVVTGGDGCPPMFAPERYSSPFKILHHCDEPRHDWYIGFQEGAMCAKQAPDTHYLKAWMPPPPMCPVSSQRELPCESSVHGEQIEHILEPAEAIMLDAEMASPEANEAGKDVSTPTVEDPSAEDAELVPQPASPIEPAPRPVPEAVAPPAELPNVETSTPAPAAPPLSPSPSDQSSTLKPQQSSLQFQPAAPRRIRTVSAEVDAWKAVHPAPTVDGPEPTNIEEIDEPSQVVPACLDAQDFTFVITTA